jgi:hypothetical protein
MDLHGPAADGKLGSKPSTVNVSRSAPRLYILPRRNARSDTRRPAAIPVAASRAGLPCTPRPGISANLPARRSITLRADLIAEYVGLVANALGVGLGRPRVTSHSVRPPLTRGIRILELSSRGKSLRRCKSAPQAGSICGGNQPVRDCWQVSFPFASFPRAFDGAEHSTLSLRRIP